MGAGASVEGAQSVQSSSVEGAQLAQSASKQTLDVAEGALDGMKGCVSSAEELGTDTATAVSDAMGNAAAEAGTEVAALLSQLPAAASAQAAAMVQGFKPILSDAQVAHAITTTFAGVGNVASSVGSMGGSVEGAVSDAGEVATTAVPVILASIAGTAVIVRMLRCYMQCSNTHFTHPSLANFFHTLAPLSFCMDHRSTAAGGSLLCGGVGCGVRSTYASRRPPASHRTSSRGAGRACAYLPDQQG
jgi:hypothetical protein